MKKRKILMIVITVSAFIFGLSLFYIDNKSDNTDARLAENKIQSKNGVQTNKTVWSEVPIKQYTAFQDVRERSNLIWNNKYQILN